MNSNLSILAKIKTLVRCGFFCWRIILEMGDSLARPCHVCAGVGSRALTALCCCLFKERRVFLWSKGRACFLLMMTVPWTRVPQRSSLCAGSAAPSVQGQLPSSSGSPPGAGAHGAGPHTTLLLLKVVNCPRLWLGVACLLTASMKQWQAYLSSLQEGWNFRPFTVCDSVRSLKVPWLSNSRLMKLSKSPLRCAQGHTCQLFVCSLENKWAQCRFFCRVRWLMARGLHVPKGCPCPLGHGKRLVMCDAKRAS